MSRPQSAMGMQAQLRESTPTNHTSQPSNEPTYSQPANQPANKPGEGECFLPYGLAETEMTPHGPKVFHKYCVLAW
jgi:hypothetical protein